MNFLKLGYLWRGFLLNLVLSMFLLLGSIFATKDNLFVLWVSGWFFGLALNELSELIHYLFKEKKFKDAEKSWLFLIGFIMGAVLIYLIFVV